MVILKGLVLPCLYKLSLFRSSSGTAQVSTAAGLGWYLLDDTACPCMVSGLCFSEV